MQVYLTIIRYPKRWIPFALLGMAIHRLPLLISKKITFFKLMGSGKNGTFDKSLDWQQWAILTVSSSTIDMNGKNSKGLMQNLYGAFIGSWLRWFNCETLTIFLQPLEGHGRWDGKEPFGDLAKQTAYEGPIAVLTRATIRISKLTTFWKNVDAVAMQMAGAEGFVTSFGIGEVPFIKQATFSIWHSKEAMKQFAYKMREHKEVIQKTRKENWYSEDMFVRFIPLHAVGSLKGKNPLEGML